MRTQLPLLILLVCGCNSGKVKEPVSVAGKDGNVSIECKGSQCVLSLVDGSFRGKPFAVSGKVVAVFVWQTASGPDASSGWVKAIFQDGRYSTFSFSLRSTPRYQSIGKEIISQAMRSNDRIVAVRKRDYEICLVWKSGAVEWRTGGRFPPDSFSLSGTAVYEANRGLENWEISEDLSVAVGRAWDGEKLTVKRPYPEK